MLAKMLAKVDLAARKCCVYFLTGIYSIGVLFWLLYYMVRHPRTKFWQTKKREKPECLKNTQYGVHRYAKLKDLTLHYVENGDNTKPLMLFIHGFPEFWYSWRHQLRAFGNAYWTIALDLRGYGESDGPADLSEYHISKIMEDIREFILSLGRQKCIIVGHDWGGILVWNFLDLYPEMVDKYIILNAPHTHTWLRVLLTNPRQFIMAWYCFFFQIPLLPELIMTMNDFHQFDVVYEKSKDQTAFGASDLEAYKYTFSVPGAMKRSINYYRSNCGLVTIKKAHPKVLPEGLFMFGDQDDYLVLDYLETAKAQISNLNIHILKDCNHFLQEFNPVIVNSAILNFLNGFDSA